MIERVIIAGAGGQGIMLLGKVLAEAASLKGLQVTWFPCYGAEVRGGTAYCMVIISDREVSSPYIDKADTLIIMNEPSLLKFKDRIKEDGIMLINSSLADSSSSSVKNRKFILKAMAFTDIASQLGSVKVANMVALGAYIKNKPLITKKEIFRVFEKMASGKSRALITINKVAVEKGLV
ncbi:MAG: 2-oxoacid:ferredoxin oxidoreductase subunit gamma [Candidatus Omnitrophota bacterium]|jgi:2-oxoglutarate ferredoxin oxidoreductase subunit gamma|nr:MAG: 2-oxoacid:ferredoxin oxidoreductase subunit gamma [Candidatus Omnitrophota bacterium]